MKECLQKMADKLHDARGAIPRPLDERQLYLWHYLKTAAESMGAMASHVEEAPTAVQALIAEAFGRPTAQELDEMERQLTGERAVRDALDEQQAYRETPGGVD